MAKVDQTTQLDITNKLSLGILSSTNSKNYFEEGFSWGPQITNSDIYAETIAVALNPTQADSNVAAAPTVLQKLTDYQLDEIPGSNGEGYSAYSTPGDTGTSRIVDWLTPQKFGTGYALILKEQDNTVINLTDGSYQTDYKNGVIRFDPAFRPIDLGYSTPLKLTVYTYIGIKGFVGGTVVVDTFVAEAFNITVPTTTFVLAQPTADVSKVFLIGNGISYSQLKGHITVSGTLVTWQAIDFANFDSSDEVVITYTV